MRRDFTFTDYGQLLHCWLLLLLADVALRLLPFSRVERWSDCRLRAIQDPTKAAAQVARLHRFVGIAARKHLYPMTCLRRSLVLRWLLGRQGVPVELKLGVRREASGLEAHAWIEYEGQPVGEAESLDRYASLSLPASRL